MNVSLPDALEQFVRAQVNSGRFRSASEVVREGLRLLEASEHQRLLEKWLLEGLSKDEEDKLPPELLVLTRARIKSLIDTGLDDAANSRVLDGADFMQHLRKKLARRVRKSA